MKGISGRSSLDRRLAYNPCTGCSAVSHADSDILIPTSPLAYAKFGSARTISKYELRLLKEEYDAYAQNYRYETMETQHAYQSQSRNSSTFEIFRGHVVHLS